MIKILTLGDEATKVFVPRQGQLVHQLIEVITFSYNLHLERTIPHQKGLFEDNKFQLQTLMKFWACHFSKIMLFRASKKLQKFRTCKFSKNSKMCQKLGNLKEILLGVRVEWEGGHQYPLGLVYHFPLFFIGEKVLPSWTFLDFYFYLASSKSSSLFPQGYVDVSLFGLQFFLPCIMKLSFNFVLYNFSFEFHAA